MINCLMVVDLKFVVLFDVVGMLSVFNCLICVVMCFLCVVLFVSIIIVFIGLLLLWLIRILRLKLCKWCRFRYCGMLGVLKSVLSCVFVSCCIWFLLKVFLLKMFVVSVVLIFLLVFCRMWVSVVVWCLVCVFVYV